MTALLLKVFEKAQMGTIHVSLPNGKAKKIVAPNPGPAGDLKIHHPSVEYNLLTKGTIGFGEDYIRGLWDSENLIDLLNFGSINAPHFEGMIYYGHFLSKLYMWIGHLSNRNTIKKSKKNIEAHYDLGNDFYQLWLDKSMTYSSGIFGGNQSISLYEAQMAKYHRILNKITQGPILEIGCGWGGFMECAAEKGHSITGLTLSPSQQAFAMKRFQGKPWEDLATVKLQDYRDEKNQYNTIVSIEMFEAVGEAYWSKYFKTIQGSLKKEGKAFIQVIVIEDKIFEGYKKRGDFIQKHIFPGGMLPSLSIFKKKAQENNLQVKEVFSFGADYAITLQKWFENVQEKEGEILSLGYSKEFLRKWYFYLAYCIAGFLSKRTDVVQIQLEHV